MTEETLHARLLKTAPERDEALAELRALIVKGLKTGLSGRAAADAAFIEDIAQVSVLRILKNLNSFEGRSKFSSWVLAIALRVAFSELRRREWKNVSLDELKERGEISDEETTTPALDGRDEEQAEMATFLREIIKTELTEKQRDVLLCELSGMPQEEIATQLGINRNAVYKLFHDARKALKRALEARGISQDTVSDLYA